MSDLDRPDLGAIRVTLEDAVKAGYCVSGIRKWCEKTGHDFRAFVKHGASAAEMVSTGDALLEELVRRKIEREGRI